MLGREFEVSIVSRMAELPDSEVITRVLAPAISTGLVENVRAGVYSFTHDLIREAVYGTLPQERVEALNHTAAVLLEQISVDPGDAGAARIASHYKQCVAVSGREPVADYSQRAGWHAVKLHAYQEARQYFFDAMEYSLGPEARECFLDDDEVPFSEKLSRCLAVGDSADPQYAELFHGLMYASAGVAATVDGISSYCIAFDCYRRAGDFENALKVLTYPLANALGSNRQTLMLEQGLEMVEEGSLQEAEILSRYGIHRCFVEGEFDAERSVSDLNRATETARRLGDADLETWSLGRRAQVYFFAAQFEDAYQTAIRGVSSAVEGAGSEAAVQCYVYVASAALMRGRLNEARVHAGVAMRLARSLNHEFRINMARQISSTISLNSGDWRGLLDESGNDSFAEIVQKHKPQNFDDTDWVAIADTTGELPDLSEFRIWSRYSAQSSGIGRIITGTQRHGGLTGEIATDWGYLFDQGRKQELPIVELWAALLDASMALDDEGGGSDVVAYERLFAAEEQFIADNGSGFGPISEVLGRLAAKMGRNDEAVVRLNQAVDWFTAGGYEPDLAWTKLELAELYLDNSGREDFEAVPALLESSGKIAAALKMGPISERVARAGNRFKELERTEHKLDGLTQRELDVLALLTDGLTNHEMANQLIITENTVASHIKNIYSKAGVNNRAEAALYGRRALERHARDER